jgi:hypothetical protein
MRRTHIVLRNVGNYLSWLFGEGGEQGAFLSSLSFSPPLPNTCALSGLLDRGGTDDGGRDGRCIDLFRAKGCCEAEVGDKGLVGLGAEAGGYVWYPICRTCIETNDG